jgi:ACT domain-containing protein
MKLTEDEVRKIVNVTIDELGENATTEMVQSVVKEVVKELERGTPALTLLPDGLSLKGSVMSHDSGRFIVTAFGKNQSGILSGLTGVLGKHDCDVQDVSQKMMQEFFTLIMLVDISKSKSDFKTIYNELAAEGEKLSVRVLAQHESIFQAMHRV